MQGWRSMGAVGIIGLCLAVAALVSLRQFVLASPLDVSEETLGQRPLTLRERLEKPCIGAHRGGSTAANSNTLARFEAALDAGVDILEMDLRLTADGVPVVHHDPEIGRGFFQEKLRIEDASLAEVRECNIAGSEPIPTFAEVLEWAAGRAVINAEFKERSVVRPSVRLVSEYDAHEWVYFQTKSDPGRYYLARAEDSQVALLFKPETPSDLDWALGLEDDRLMVIEFFEPMRTEENIRRVREAGKFASENSWHFTPLQEVFGSACTRAWDAGMDIAITKHPGHAVRLRESYRQDLRSEAPAQ